jgi:hypothetical protein
MMRRLVLLSILLLPAIAHAQARTLIAPNYSMYVIVWKNGAARSEGRELIKAGVHKTNPRLLLPLIACTALSGSEAVVTDGGAFSSTITVTSGQAAGCRGDIDNDWLKK